MCLGYQMLLEAPSSTCTSDHCTYVLYILYVLMHKPTHIPAHVSVSLNVQQHTESSVCVVQ